MKKLLGLVLVAVLFLTGCNGLNSSIVPSKKEVITIKDTTIKMEKPAGYSEPKEKPEDAEDASLLLKKDNIDAAFGIWTLKLEEAVSLKDHIERMSQFEFETMKIGDKEVYRGHQSVSGSIIYLYLFDFGGYRMIVSASSVEKNIDAFRAEVEKAIESMKQ